MAEKKRPGEIRVQAENARRHRAVIDRLALEGVGATVTQLRSNFKRSVWSAEDEWEFLRIQCRDRFWPFFLHAWGTLYGPHAEDWLSKRAPISELMANWYEHQIREWLASRERREDNHEPRLQSFHERTRRR